ncbi:MAG: putative porin [Salinibacter sp.]
MLLCLPSERISFAASAAGRAVILVCALLVLAGRPAAHGQADTTAAPADSAQRPGPPADTASADTTLAPQPVPSVVRGRTVLDSLPARSIHVGLEHVLAQHPGSFLYDLGAVGWPHGWSTDGLPPHYAGLWVEERPYTDPFLGRPRFDLLPAGFLAPPRVDPGPDGAPVGVHTTWREYDRERPITELRFRRASNGLKAVEVGHSQKRRLSLGGAPGLLQLSIGFGGRATDGTYAGSDLRRERRLWGRLRYQQDNWGVSVSDLSSRHRIGAHGGVEPPGQTFETIYLLPPAADNVRNAGARRRTFRNDLTARAWGPLVPGTRRPTVLSGTWTVNTFDFEPGGGQGSFGTDPDTTWTVQTTGGHLSAQQDAALGRHALTFTARGQLWKVGRSNVPQVQGTRWGGHLTARDSVRLGANDIVLDAGWHRTDAQQYPSLGARATRSLGSGQVSASLQLAGRRPDWIEETGFAGLVVPGVSPDRSSRVLKGTLGASTRIGPVDLEMKAFAHQIQDGVDLYAPAGASSRTDTVAARPTPSPLRRVGTTLSLGWRRAADRGLYATGAATAQRTLQTAGSPRRERLARTLPSVYGQGRMGGRFVFFDDLITDLYVEARGWTDMNSRWFHPPTGRMAVPPLASPVPDAPSVRLGPSGTVDAHAEVTLRGATLFFSFENIQAGTELQPGTFVVPVYPLSARQFRFGVFWPIFD